MKLKLATATLIVAAVQMTSALATTVNLSGSPTNTFRFADSNGGLLPDGSLILIGSMTDPNDSSTFTEFAAAATGSVATFPGFGLGGVTDNSPAASAFDGSEIYLWVFASATSDPAADNSIFRATDPNAPAGAGDPWFFPTNAGDGSDIIAIDLLAIDTGTVLDPTSGSVGNAFGVSVPADGFSQQIHLHPAIPEPSAGMLSLLSIAGLLLMRRRA